MAAGSLSSEPEDFRGATHSHSRLQKQGIQIHCAARRQRRRRWLLQRRRWPGGCNAKGAGGGDGKQPGGASAGAPALAKATDANSQGAFVGSSATGQAPRRAPSLPPCGRGVGGGFLASAAAARDGPPTTMHIARQIAAVMATHPRLSHESPFFQLEDAITDKIIKMAFYHPYFIKREH